MAPESHKHLSGGGWEWGAGVEVCNRIGKGDLIIASNILQCMSRQKKVETW